MTAWWVGSVVLCGKTLTSLLVSASADGTWAGIAAKNASRSWICAATRGGDDARPGAQVGHRGGERLDELVDVEEPLDLGAAEDQHRADPIRGGRTFRRPRLGRA